MRYTSYYKIRSGSIQQKYVALKQLNCRKKVIFMQDQIKMYTTTWCPDCLRSKRVMQMLNVDFDEINIEEDEEAVATVVRLNNGMRRVPTIVFPDGDVLVEPSNLDLTKKLEAVVL